MAEARWAVRRIANSSLARNLITTSAANIGTTVFAGVAGVFIARGLGPQARGEYASMIAWLVVGTTVGQLGLTSAITYYVAKEPDRAPSYAATARNLMFGTGAVVAVVGYLVAPVLAGSSDSVWAYRTLFFSSVAAFAGMVYIFSLQASHIPTWNIIRISQPVGYLVVATLLYVGHALTLMAAAISLLALTIAQSLAAWVLCRQRGLGSGTASRERVGPLLAYGSSNLAATVPAALATKLDQMVISLAGKPVDLGHYAVALSLTSLAVPVVAAIGNVMLPRLASNSLAAAEIEKIQRRSIIASVVIGVVILSALAISANWLVPFVFGDAYRPAVVLVALLAPGGVALACIQVLTDLLRGRGAPASVAVAQIAAAIAMIVLMIPLMAAFGIYGAAVSASLSALVAATILLFRIRRITARGQQRPSDRLDAELEPEGEPCTSA